MTAITHGGLPGCVTAAEHHGLWVPPQKEVHVWMSAGGHRRTHDGCECIDHWDDPPMTGARVVSVEHSLAQIAACSTGETFFVCLESALRQQKLDVAGLRWLRAGVSAHAREVIDLARTDVDSGIESIVRFRLLRLGIEVESQWEVPGVGRVDFLVGDRLLIEIDGRLNHEGPSLRHKDLVRDAQAAALGFETLRFDYALVMYDWELVEAAILNRVIELDRASLRTTRSTRRLSDASASESGPISADA